MDFITLIVIAVGLSMDAFAVSVVSGAAYRKLNVEHALRMAAFFGGFQALMPLIGFVLAFSVKQYIQSFDHWIAFGLLTAVGVKMVYESFKIKSAEEKFNPSSIRIVLVLSVATSIDALAIGFTLSVLEVSILFAAVVIGGITFVLSVIGVWIGKRFGHFFENKIEAVGGLVLIGLGVKILVEHLAA